MLTIANKGRYMVKKCQKHVYVICEGSLMYHYCVHFWNFQKIMSEEKNNLEVIILVKVLSFAKMNIAVIIVS